MTQTRRNARQSIGSDDRAPEGLLDTARTMSPILAEVFSEEDRLSYARSYCYRLVAAWWRVLVADDAGLPIRPLFEALDAGCLPELSAMGAETMGRAVAASPVEIAAFSIGSTYTGMLPGAFRSRNGVFYTPPPLAARLIQQASEAGTDWKSARILDPACGGGAFLAPVAQRIINALPDVAPQVLVQNIGNRLRGFEIDPFAAWLAQVMLDAVMLPVCREAGHVLPVVVSTGDSLVRPLPSEGYDLVIGNPPYGRVRLSAEERSQYRRGLFGHANLYGLFTDMALRHVKPGGVVAFVTPTSFLAGEYFKNLRALIGEEAPPTAIDLVGTRKGVFEGVLQETLLATYRRAGKPEPARVNELLPNGAGKVRVTRTGSFTLPKDRSQPWMIPRTSEQDLLIKLLRSFTHRLVDWGYGVSTGQLVWNRHKSQLRRHNGNGSHPLIWAEAVTSDGRFVFRAEKRNHEPYFEPIAGDEWLITRTPCVLLQRTTAKEQSRRLIAALLPEAFLEEHGAVVIENHLNMLRPLVKKPAVSPMVLSAFLNSGAADRAFRCVSGSVAVSAYELESLPLPSPESLMPVAELVRGGASKERIEFAFDQLFVTDEGCERPFRRTYRAKASVSACC